MSEPVQNLPCLTLIAAMSVNRVIGLEGKMPWRLKSDMARFRKETKGKPVIVGRRTFADIGQALPERTLIVLSSSRTDYRHRDIRSATSFAEAVDLARQDAEERDAGEIMVAGGAAVYAEALPTAHRIVLTIVEKKLAGDTYFPQIDLDLWSETDRLRVFAGPGDDYATTFLDLRRGSASSPARERARRLSDFVSDL